MINRLDNSNIHLKELASTLFSNTSLPNDFCNNFMFTGSGKAALILILSFLKKSGILQSKMDSIIVPQWIGTAVSHSVLNEAFITSSFTGSEKAMLVYHQYGFPQNMDKVTNFCLDKKLIMIEDCAHTIQSNYNGIPLGTFGDFSIRSFSKFSFCFALGGLSFKDEDFLDFFQEKRKQSSYSLLFLINAFKILDEFSLNHAVNFEKLRRMLYSLYHEGIRNSRFAEKMFLSNFDNEINKRKRNYKYLRSSLNKYTFMDSLEEDVVPYALPLMIRKNRDKIISDLKEKKIECGEYWFDTNRFLIEPNFERCVLVPIHSNVKISTLDYITETIKKHA